MDSNLSFPPPHRSWREKFRDSGRGLVIGLRDGNSFNIHLFAAFATLLAAVILRVSRTDWCLLILCIASVFTAEYLNSGLESLAKAVTRERDPFVRDALDLGSGAVAAISLGAVAIGLIIFLPYLIQMFG